MKNKLKLIISLMLAFAMAVSFNISTFAANWNASDKITINVRVYDASTGNVYEVGTDSVTKGDQYIQSDPYKIPQLSNFTSNSYGTVQKVVGNWYFPSGDSSVGATVYWSCNVNSVTMTYWVSYYSTGSGTGGSSTDPDTTDLGGSGSKTINFKINYHSNYPDGTDYVVTKKYTVKSFVAGRATSNSELNTSYTDCGFGGYTPLVNEKTWYRAGNNQEVMNYITVENNKTYDLYAGWDTGGTPVTKVTLTYKDGDAIYATVSCFAGDSATAIVCSNQKDGYTFAGWSTVKDGELTYAAGDVFTVSGDMTLYAVWTENQHTHTPGEAVKENVVEPTCTEEGSYDEVIKCTECEEEISREHVIVPANGHTPGEPVIENEVPATFTKEGSYDEVIYCEVCGEELSRITKTIPIKEIKVVFKGGSLRVPDNYSMTEGADNTEALQKTNLRFGYEFTLPEGMSIDNISWSWNWGSEESNLSGHVEGANYTNLGNNTYRTNLVITGIPVMSAYDQPIYAQITVVYTDDEGNTLYATGDVDIKSRTVKFIVDAIARNIDAGTCSEPAVIQSYVKELRDRMQSYYN